MERTRSSSRKKLTSDEENYECAREQLVANGLKGFAAPFGPYGNPIGSTCRPLDDLSLSGRQAARAVSRGLHSSRARDLHTFIAAFAARPKLVRLTTPHETVPKHETPGRTTPR